MLVFLFAGLASSDVSLFSFTTVISALVGIASFSISLMFLVSSEIVKNIFGKKRKEKISTEKLLHRPL